MRNHGMEFYPELVQRWGQARTKCQLRIIGDENSCAEADSKLAIDVPGRWDCLHDGGVFFMSSSQTPGLQIADMVVHTLYRVNKMQVPDPSLEPPRVSNFDRIAAK